jgi:hypothetical protein
MGLLWLERVITQYFPRAHTGIYVVLKPLLAPEEKLPASFLPVERDVERDWVQHMQAGHSSHIDVL